MQTETGTETGIEAWQWPHMALLAADMVLFARRGEGPLHVLLIERAEDPFAGYWALPGGLLEVQGQETFEGAARRELFEETGLVAPPQVRRVGVYDAPERDSRRRVISVAYTGELPDLLTAVADDDAAAAAWQPVSDVLNATLRLAFDHLQIVRDAYNALQREPWM
jgi:8-oxo-dGTP diphosphatase